jgi:hypothetical protein
MNLILSLTNLDWLEFWVPEFYITTNGQSASLSWNIWGLRPDFYYCLTVAGLLIWGALSDGRTGLSFTVAAGPRQRSYFRVRVPWESWPYFTVSDSTLPFSSPPTTRRVTVEVFDPASTRDDFNSRINSLFVIFLGPCRSHLLQGFYSAVYVCVVTETLLIPW